MTKSHLYNLKKEREGNFPQLVMTISESLVALQIEIKAQMPYSRSEQTSQQAYLERVAPYFEKLTAGFQRDFARLPADLQKERAALLMHVQTDVQYGMEQISKNAQLTVEAKLELLEEVLKGYESLENAIPENGQVVEKHVKAGEALLGQINAVRDTLTQEPAAVLKRLDSALLVMRADMQNELMQSQGPNLHRPDR